LKLARRSFKHNSQRERERKREGKRKRGEKEKRREEKRRQTFHRFISMLKKGKEKKNRTLQLYVNCAFKIHFSTLILHHYRTRFQH